MIIQRELFLRPAHPLAFLGKPSYGICSWLLYAKESSTMASLIATSAYSGESVLKNVSYF